MWLSDCGRVVYISFNPQPKHQNKKVKKKSRQNYVYGKCDFNGKKCETYLDGIFFSFFFFE